MEEKFKKHRNYTNNLIKKAVRENTGKNITSASNVKDIWNSINDILKPEKVAKNSIKIETNGKLIEDPLPQQRIGYMNNITLPSTRLDVVRETMRISNEVRKECGEEYMVPTYDLAIAKPALKIQEEERPDFDSLFVAFGTMHIEGCLDGTSGYYLDGSGGLELLVYVGLAP